MIMGESSGGTLEVKTCPQCGQELFADMGMCFGCMYEFASRAMLRVSSPDLACTVAIPEEGLVVGRGSSCDIVLHDRAVSRQHVRIVAEGAGVNVHDLGSTNVPIVRGRPLKGSVHLDPGEELEICGTTLMPVAG